MPRLIPTRWALTRWVQHSEWACTFPPPPPPFAAYVALSPKPRNRCRGVAIYSVEVWSTPAFVPCLNCCFWHVRGGAPPLWGSDYLLREALRALGCVGLTLRRQYEGECSTGSAALVLGSVLMDGMDCKRERDTSILSLRLMETSSR